MKELKTEPKIENMEAVSDFVESSLQEDNCPVRAVMKFLVALDEMLNNVVSYSHAHEVDILVGRDGKRYYVRLEDDGSPFDPLAQPEPDISLAAEDRGVGGLGIYMVRKSMSRVTYLREDGKNKLCMELDT
ncbi:MAG: ATP-binding protein [Lachnospiraceae bacterium]|jgi:serine/threonine-protein kinase RsbW|nr:ATP-binding protein [Lachnospiraceae bacterium]